MINSEEIFFFSVYLKIGGVCGLVAVGAMALFTVFSGEASVSRIRLVMY